MRALIAPDKFKGSLTAAAVADRLTHGLRAAGVDNTTLPLANTCGLTTLPLDHTAALEANSLGIGHAVAHALRTRPRRLVIALGGSASTDAGTGLLAGLGYAFRDHTGNQLPASGRARARVPSIDTTAARSLG